MSKLVELTEKDFNYLKTLDLELFKSMTMYFDYDLIMKSIEMTPNEIYEMEDGYDYQVISWFDELLFNDLEAFNGEYFVDELTAGKERIQKRCPLNNKNSEEYKKYVTLKKVFASSLKAVVDGKSEVIYRDYESGMKAKDNVSDEVQEFKDNLNTLTDGKYQEESEYAELINLDNSLKDYKTVWKDKKKPKIKEETTLNDIIEAVLKSTRDEKLDDYEKGIIDYLTKFFDVDNLSEVIGRNVLYHEENMTCLIFAAQALLDKEDYSKDYKAIFSQKKEARNALDEAILKDYSNSAVYNSVKALDSMLMANLEAVNIYDKLCSDVMYYSSRYDYLKKIGSESKEEVEKNNNQFFIKNDFGKDITYSIKKDDKSVTLGNRLTKEELASDEEKVVKAREALLAEDKELTDKKALADIVEKFLQKKDLSQKELELLAQNGIDSNLSAEELKTKVSELVDRIKELEDTALERTAKKEALLKTSDILGTSSLKRKAAKKSKDLVDFVKTKAKGVWSNKKKILGRSLSGVVGGAIGGSLAFVLGPVGIVLVNAAVVPIITQAYAYANKLEATELTGETVEIENVDKGSNKITAKVNSFLRKSHFEKIKKLADFNMFAKLANSKNETISKVFSNKEVLRNIGAGLTSALVALDLAALTRATSRLVDKYKQNTSQPSSSAPSNSAPSSNSTGDNTPGGNNPGGNNSVDKIDYGDPKPVESVKIGDTIGTENKITVGYKTSYDARLGINPVKLNQDIMYDGSSVIKEAYYYHNGVMEKLAVDAKDLTKTIQNMGIDPSDIVVNLAKDGVEGRAWVSGEVAAKSLGLTLVP